MLHFSQSKDEYDPEIEKEYCSAKKKDNIREELNPCIFCQKQQTLVERWQSNDLQCLPIGNTEHLHLDCQHPEILKARKLLGPTS